MRTLSNLDPSQRSQWCGYLRPLATLTTVCNLSFQKGGINTNVRYGGIYIKSLVLGGAADQDGRIQIGMIIFLFFRSEEEVKASDIQSQFLICEIFLPLLIKLD